MRAKVLQLLIALATAVALAIGVPAAADVGSGSGPPTSIGTGGAAASVEKLATQASIDILRRGGNAVDAAVACGRGARRDRALLLWHRGRRLHGHSQRRRPRDDDRRSRDGTCGHASDLLLGERCAAAVQRRALQRSLRRRSRHGRNVGGRAGEVRDDVARQGLRARDPRRAPRLSHRPGVVRPGQREPRLVRRRPGQRRPLPRRRRHAARRRHGVHEPGAGEDVRADRASRRQGLLPRCGRGRARRDGPAPAGGAYGESRLALRRDEDA